MKRAAILPKGIVKFQFFFLEPAIAFDLVSFLIAELVLSIVHGSYSIGPFTRRRSGDTDVNLVSRAKPSVFWVSSDLRAITIFADRELANWVHLCDFP